MTIITVTMSDTFDIIYAMIVREHLRAIDKKFHAQIRDAIELLLRFEPDLETRNRKPIKTSDELEATWEIRCGANNRFRVFYDVDTNQRTVYVLAIGVKVGNRLYIGGEEIEI